jgi:hypothetical protein
MLVASRSWIVLSLFLLIVVGSGCKLVDRDKINGKSPLAPLETTPDQIALEIVFLRLVGPDAQIDPHLWDEIDEQSISAVSRRHFARNGFRAGVLGNQLPPRLAALASRIPLSDGAAASVPADPEQTGATLRWMYLNPQQRGELVASSVQPEFHILDWEQGEVSGETFRDAQAQFGVLAEATDDGRSRVKLIPEVHHGHFLQRYVRGEGMFRLYTSRSKKVLDALAIEGTINPGQIMIVSSNANQRGSLGHRFFNERLGDKQTVKLLMIRWAESGQEVQSPFSVFAKAEPADKLLETQDGTSGTDGH